MSSSTLRITRQEARHVKWCAILFVFVCDIGPKFLKISYIKYCQMHVFHLDSSGRPWLIFVTKIKKNMLSPSFGPPLTVPVKVHHLSGVSSPCDITVGWSPEKSECILACNFGNLTVTHGFLHFLGANWQVWTWVGKVYDLWTTMDFKISLGGRSSADGCNVLVIQLIGTKKKKCDM